ncbi:MULTISPECIES: type I-E CRISPR-associated protein Cse2/CasB [Mycolicibacter]|uniref:Type I-E CRISPR-associated protein Cse2/CasB n=2 Tax=Mycolicibacter TaxID=1073531 RepID=A0ABU5XN39_9MYCO|nr:MULTISPECIES: type I-E CRISPR-associated protein Cse2/CasB [unclassified Mycolicibacter]MEB3023399.1 type I-E CRISPR-associated protein Cse2/CasB [Mycolicibacter sp. MYC098]MEB3033741.1 type I-E CRISPR-associated protein Cse2/CasB [Mycolicibacter sp. MYC340]
MGDEKPVETARDERFVRRLAQAHRSRAETLNAARRWQPGVVDHRVVALTCLDTEPASASEYPCWAQTAKLFAIWHGGRTDPQYGYAGNGIGRWAHQLGVGDPSAERLIDRITAAATPLTLDAALTALARRRTPRPPHWATVLAELADWSDPARQDQVRFAWARDFYSFPRSTKAVADADVPAAPPA